MPYFNDFYEIVMHVRKLKILYLRTFFLFVAITSWMLLLCRYGNLFFFNIMFLETCV